MKGLIQDYQLTLPGILKRAEELYGDKEIVTRNPDKSFHRYTYADFVRRAKKLAVALGELGLHKSNRVATLAWNSYQHLEAYFGIPCAGLVLQAINPRLSADDITYIINHAEDRVLLIDETMVKLLDALGDRVNLEHVFVLSGHGSAPEGQALVTGRRRGAQAMPLLRDGSQLQPRPRPRTRRVRSGWINARRAPCPAALPRGLGASRRYAVPLRSEAMDRGDEIRSDRMNRGRWKT